MSGIKGRSGGARSNTGPKSKISSPEALQAWKMNLKRAIVIAASNHTVLKKKSFYTTKQIAARFGKGAVRDFKYWFEASKHFDSDVADALAQEKLDEDLYKKLLFTQAYFWVWSVRPERQKEAWQISRGFRELT